MFKIENLFFTALALVACSTLVSCSEDVNVMTESSITYTLTMSPDLLKFVTPQVSYVDENGNLVKLTGVEELDGKVIENQAEISYSNGGTEVHASGWTQQVIVGTGYKCWVFKVKFNRLNFHSYMGVKYLRNDFIEDTEGKVYDFHHSINTGITALKSTITEKNGFSNSTDVEVKSFTDSHTSITLLDYHWGDNIDTYLDHLTNNPDKVGYYVDDNGDVTRRDEFDI